MSAAHLRVGDMRIAALLDGVARLDRSYFSGVDWARHGHLLDRRGQLCLPVGCFLVEARNGYVLIDAGVGPRDIGWARGGRLARALERLNINRNQITAVGLTHLHADHVGWLVHDSAPFFPAAEVHVSAIEEAWARSGSARTAAMLDVLARADRLRPFDDAAHRLSAGLVMQAAPGHTPGHHLVLVASGASRAVILGDLVVSPVQIGEPEITNISDADPILARKVRERVWRSVDVATPLVGAHFPQLRFGRIIGDGLRRHFATGR